MIPVKTKKYFSQWQTTELSSKAKTRALGQTSELGKFDALRTIKYIRHKKQKPTALGKAQYEKLTSVLNTQISAIDNDLKQQRKAFYQAQGTFPN